MNEPLPIVVANLKANKTWDEVALWIDDVAKTATSFAGTIIFCPSYPFLASAFAQISQNGINLKLGSQDISRFEQGAYTGEVAASQIADLVKYAIIGHSERRKYFGETNEDVIEKVKLLLTSKITPVLCISDLKQLDTYIAKGQVIMENADQIIFVYEPPSAISGGGEFRPDSPQNANEQVARIKERIGREVITIYGGSITPQNAQSFFQQENINGGLVGQASLDPQKFMQILMAARK